MNIDELPDTDLSAWIAEKLEPVLPPHPLLDSEYLSPKLLWQWQLSQDCVLKCSWQPRDMVSDPAMTVMLMERMIRLDCTHLVLQTWPSGCRLDMHVWPQPIAVPAETIGRAVVEAFAIANGWKG